jgi:hypothetical protein
MTPDHDITHYGSFEGGYRKLCSLCFNADVAERCGLDEFENIRLDTIELTDDSGNVHQFHFRTHLLGRIVSLDAFELQDGSPGGYQFQMIGDPEDDLYALLGRMIEKIRRALGKQHIDDGEFGLQIKDLVVRGSIDSDISEPEPTPLLVIDGREVTWEQFGRMLMTFEGWQFKLELLDRSEEA